MASDNLISSMVPLLGSMLETGDVVEAGVDQHYKVEGGHDVEAPGVAGSRPTATGAATCHPSSAAVAAPQSARGSDCAIAVSGASTNRRARRPALTRAPRARDCRCRGTVRSKFPDSKQGGTVSVCNPIALDASPSASMLSESMESAVSLWHVLITIAVIVLIGRLSFDLYRRHRG